MIPVNEPIFPSNEKKYLNECIETGWISSEGPFVKRFEKEFSQQVNKKHGIAVANGTAALEIAVKALGLSTNDEVIMPTFTIISCAAAIVKTGAVPVVVDSDPLTWNMDCTQIEAAITPKTKAIMVVHIYGLPVDMAPILKLAQKYNLKIIEDTAQAIGQTYNGQPCGSFGDISTFSFYPNKHITTGEGGMIVCNCEDLAQRCRELRNLCFQGGYQRFIHHELGWNYRMTNLQAAVGCAQLEVLEQAIQRKRQIGLRYLKNLNDISSIQLPLDKTEYADNLFWIFGLVLKDNIDFTPEDLAKKLGEQKIGTRPFFWCMHEQPVLKEMGLFDNITCPVSEKMARQGLYIPSGLAITDEQIDIVSEALRKLLPSS